MSFLLCFVLFVLLSAFFFVFFVLFIKNWKCSQSLNTYSTFCYNCSAHTPQANLYSRFIIPAFTYRILLQFFYFYFLLVSLLPFSKMVFLENNQIKITIFFVCLLGCLKINKNKSHGCSSAHIKNDCFCYSFKHLMGKKLRAKIK